jgi:hypothetical protein
LPSSSMVRIFCRMVSCVLGSGEMSMGIRSRHRWWKCKTRCMCRRRNAAADKTFQHRSFR